MSDIWLQPRGPLASQTQVYLRPFASSRQVRLSLWFLSRWNGETQSTLDQILSSKCVQIYNHWTLDFLRCTWNYLGDGKSIVTDLVGGRPTFYCLSNRFSSNILITQLARLISSVERNRWKFQGQAWNTPIQFFYVSNHYHQSDRLDKIRSNLNRSRLLFLNYFLAQIIQPHYKANPSTR